LELKRGEIEAIPNGASSYIVPVREAQRLVANKEASWDGPKRIKLKQDHNVKGSWIPKQSGFAGPLVLQFQA